MDGEPGPWVGAQTLMRPCDLLQQLCGLCRQRPSGLFQQICGLRRQRPFGWLQQICGSRRRQTCGLPQQPAGLLQQPCSLRRSGPCQQPALDQAPLGWPSFLYLDRPSTRSVDLHWLLLLVR